MTMLQALLERQSVPPRLMTEAGPSAEELRQIMAAAVTAPDHGSVRPWRFVVIEGENRNRLGDVFAEALMARDPGAKPDALEKERGRPLRAPTVVAVLARVVHDRPNVPPVEQIVATACAAQTMLLAANAMGYGGIMLTGKNAQDPHVRKFFGLADGDELVAFLYLGKAADRQPAKERPDPLSFVEPFGAHG